jgi:hypothetical protein
VLALLKAEKRSSQRAAEDNVHPYVLREWRTIAVRNLAALCAQRDTVTSLRAAHQEQVEDRSAPIVRLTTQLAWIKKNPAATLTRAERRALGEPSNGAVSLTT